MEGNVGDRGGQREHYMEVADREKIGLLGFEPGTRCGALAPRTVPVATGVIGDPLMPAVGTGFNVTAQGSGATGLDRRHDLELVQAQVTGMGSAIGRTGSPEDIGDLNGGAHRSAVGRLAFHQRHQSIKRAGDRVDRSGGHLGVERGRLELAVPEQDLDDADVGAIFEKVGGEAVP